MIYYQNVAPDSFLFLIQMSSTIATVYSYIDVFMEELAFNSHIYASCFTKSKRLLKVTILIFKSHSINVIPLLLLLSYITRMEIFHLITYNSVLEHVSNNIKFHNRHTFRVLSKGFYLW